MQKSATNNSWWQPDLLAAGYRMSKGLNETGAYFFSQIKSGLSTESIINDAAERYETTTEIIAPSFGNFLQALVDSGYLQEIPESTPPAKPKTDQ